MQIGAIIGLFLALILVTLIYFWSKSVVAKMNLDPVIVATRGRAHYHVSRGKVIIICMFGITGGAIVGWLVN